MNVNLTRRVQLSIMDPNKPFDMNHWDHCIFGHLIKVQYETGELNRERVAMAGAVCYGAMELGISTTTARALFTTTMFDTRQRAVSALDKLIRDEEQLPRLGGEAPSQSPRPTHQEPDFADFSAESELTRGNLAAVNDAEIDAILLQAAAEEVLVG